MARGGARLGAGAKAKWKHGKTKTIRVPVVLALKILDYAEKLDNGVIIENDTISKTLNFSGISVRQHNGIAAIYLEDLVKAGYEILPESLSNLVKARIQKLEIDKQLKYGNNTQNRRRN